MAAQANNPFGTAPQQVLHNPFGAPASSQTASAFGNPFQSPFGAAAPNSSPFGAPAAKPFGAPVSNPFGAPVPGSKPPSTATPFGAPTQPSALSTPAASRQPSPNPFAKPPAQPQTSKPFGAPSGPKSGRTPSPFGSRAPPTGPSNHPVSEPPDANAMGRRNKFTGGKPSAPTTNGGFGGRGGLNQGPQRATPFAGTKPFAKQPNGLGTETNKKPQAGGKGKQPQRQERYQPPPSKPGTQQTTGGGPSERTKQLSTFAFNYANRLCDHLRKENISPPKWPAELGNPDKRGAVENLKEAYKKYRTRVYTSLRKVDLIDDPDKRRKLEDALPFKGICEDMCPDFEQVYRIAEYDVKTEEKEMRPDGVTMWPETSRMVKKFGRSAAGQEAPLPMDVRSVDALRRTTDYLFNDLLQSESNLPSMHNFLWDRTRAVRKDFTFHSQKSAEEMKEMVYCFETITRFHATALHLLSKPGFANEDFNQKQEIEQLGRTILSLIEAYDMCRDKRVHCENEPEFRAYYLLLNAHDPSIAKRIPTWGKEYWFESEEVQTALSLIHAMDDVREPKGPIKPRRPTTLSDMSFTNYFSIVEDTRVSYTMACVAEVHFTTVRQGILRNLVRGYARHRDAPRTITASDLNAMLRFDTPEEAVDFAELHDFEFSTWVPEGKNPVTEPYLLLNNKKKHVPSPRVRQAFSGKVVERKRTTESLPHVIYNTIFEQPTEQIPSPESSPDGMFVGRAAVSETLAQSSPTFPPPAQPSAASTTTMSPFGAATSSTPFGMTTPATAAPTTMPTTAFSGFPASQPSTSTAPSPFAAFGQPASQAQPVQSPFSFQNQAPASSTTDTTPKTAPILGQSAQTGQTTASPFAPAKPAEPSNPFGFLKDTSLSKAPSTLPATQQPAPALPSAPSFLGNAAPTAPKPATSASPAQDTASAPAKPAGLFPTPSILGSAPPAGAPPFSTTPFAPPAQQQSTTAAPAVPSILVSTPSTTTAPTTQSAPSFSTAPPQPLGQTSLPGPVSQTPAFSALGSTAASTLPQPPPTQDLLGDFTRWFVTGDDGLMEHFTEETLRNMLWAVWQRHGREEAERKRREEDEESWRLAREHQTSRLQVKYFYRWRSNARALATKRILREGKEKMRLYREQQKAIKRQLQEEKEKADREARRAAKRQLMEDSQRLTLLASSSGRRGSVAYSTDHNPEEQLIASGIFGGLRDDPRSVARRVVREAANGADASALGSTSRSFRYAESELELEPARSPGDSPDTSSVGGRREGWKTRSLREKFNLEPRRSLSASGSVVNGGSFMSSSSRFRQSLPGSNNNKTTNFSASSRKRPADDESDDGQSGYHGAKTNGFSKSRHWDMRVRGLVPTPDGGYLPEALAKSTMIRSVPAHHQDDGTGSAFGSPNDERDLYLPDAGRAPSPTPSDLRLRLARLKKRSHYYPARSGHAPRHSVDLPGGFAAEGRILSTSPPHPPFASASSMQPPPPPRVGNYHGGGDRIMGGMGGMGGMGMGAKRKRGSDGEEEEDEAMEREVSPSARKRAAVLGHGSGSGSGGGGGGVVPGREETSAIVENTKRMLREVRELMDRADRDEGGY